MKHLWWRFFANFQPLTIFAKIFHKYFLNTFFYGALEMNRLRPPVKYLWWRFFANFQSLTIFAKIFHKYFLNTFLYELGSVVSNGGVL